MKIAIITARNGIVEVHAAGCTDVAKSAKRNHDDPWFMNVGSLVETSEIYWGDVISDTVDPNSAEGKAIAREYATSQFNCLPCAKALPFDAEDPKTISVWVGWKIADAAIAAGGTLGAKLEARKPNAVLDRTVKLTRTESESLAALATDLETAALGTKGAGPLVYSARTLRDRLAAAWS